MFFLKKQKECLERIPPDLFNGDTICRKTLANLPLEMQFEKKKASRNSLWETVCEEIWEYAIWMVSSIFCSLKKNVWKKHPKTLDLMKGFVGRMFLKLLTMNMAFVEDTHNLLEKCYVNRIDETYCLYKQCVERMFQHVYIEKVMCE